MTPPHFRGLAPVDSNGLPDQLGGVKKKRTKVEESATPYAAKKPAKAAPAPAQPGEIRYATPDQVKKAAQEVFEVHKELFRKLAQ